MVVLLFALFSFLSYLSSYGQCLTIPRSGHEAAQFLERERHRGVRSLLRVWLGQQKTAKINHACVQARPRALPNHIAYHALLPAGLGRRLANEIPTLVERTMLASSLALPGWRCLLQLDVFGSQASRHGDVRCEILGGVYFYCSRALPWLLVVSMCLTGKKGHGGWVTNTTCLVFV